jgi:AraC-like DNA-binding protein
MAFPAYCLHLPVVSADEATQAQIKAYLETLKVSSQHVTSRQVEQLIREFLSTGNCTIAHIAKFLSVSVRTLQNRLEAEHTSFHLLLEKVRRELAIGHLSRNDMQLTELAYLLGYSELSAFSRGFKRWYGTSPKNWRQNQL